MLKSRKKVAACLAGLLLCLSLLEARLNAKEKEEWTPEDILQAETAGSFEISPDSRWAVFTKSRMDKETNGRISNIFLTSLTGENEIQLTRGTDSSFNLRWSPDGKRVAFLSSRELPKDKTKGEAGRIQLWLINPQGGEAWSVTSFERGLNSFEWRDNDTIVFSAQEDRSLYEREVKKAKDTSNVVDDAAHRPPVRLYLLEVDKGKVTRVTTNDDWIQGFAVSPDGKWAASVHQRSVTFTFDHKVTPALFVTNLDTGESKEVDPEERLVPRGLEWAKDSRGFYFAREYSSHPLYFTAGDTRLYYYDLAPGRSRQVDLGWENNLGGGFVATPDGFVALLAEGVRFRVARYTKSGESWQKQDLEGTHVRNLFRLTLSRDGETMVYLHSTASTPTQWYRAKLDGHRITGEQQLTHLNKNYEGKPVYKTEVVRWTGARNDQVDGVLYYPLDYEEGKKYPLMLSIHGGPTGWNMDAWGQSYGYPKILLAQRGTFQLEVNYHGSGNYGREWAESLGGGNYYDLEHLDLMGGVNYLIERGLVDPDKLGTMGWSNGAILTTDLVSRYPGRFKVASAGAGDVEWISDWGNVMFGASFDNYYFGKPPYEDPQLYIRKSPYFRLKDVTTPTILYTGTNDVNVPPSQSWSHYRVLQQATDTPVKFITFPGEPHGLRKYVHQRRKLMEDLAWFDKYLFQTYEEPNEAFEEGSPLDVALKIKEVARDGSRYGTVVKKTLIPEVVGYNGLDIGRFEVTRAQFAAFDKNYAVTPGTENYPANGISFEQARAYATWLSKLTGETYRVPNANEVRAAFEKARGNENTLDYWAGYNPNPDDAERLQAKVAELKGEAPLLREVGQFQGRGDEELVFDLGGNVAEWAVGEGGDGLLLGGSADRPADAKAHGTEAGAAYRGFRVLKGEAHQ